MPYDGVVRDQRLESLPFNERWSVNNNAEGQPRDVANVMDVIVLYWIWNALETRWAKRFNDGDNHCIVGWVAQYCEPSTVITNFQYSEKSLSVMRRLYDALPKSARRGNHAMYAALAKYNDTHGLPAVRRWVKRACLRQTNASLRWPSILNEADFNGKAEGEGDRGDGAGAERASPGAHGRSSETAGRQPRRLG